MTDTHDPSDNDPHAWYPDDPEGVQSQDDPDESPHPKAVSLSTPLPTIDEYLASPPDATVFAGGPLDGVPKVTPRQADDSGARWVCSGCGATWKADPGTHHTHEEPVPGSKSRKTYVQHRIDMVPGGSAG